MSVENKALLHEEGVELQTVQNGVIDLAWIQATLPNKPRGKCEAWLQQLLEQEVSTLKELRDASEGTWARVGLPGAVRDSLKLAIGVSVDPAYSAEEPDEVSPFSMRDVGAHLASFFTLTQWGSRYRRALLPKDLLAGITVGVFAVPQCMSFATVAGLPPLYGLYCAFISLFLYPFLGTSPHLLNGPTAVMSLLASGAVPLSPMHSALDTGPAACGDPLSDGCQVRIALIASIALLAGVLQMALALCNFGTLINLVSDTVIVAFTGGSAFLIVGTQLSGIFGISRCAAGDPSCELGLGVVDTLANIFTKTEEISGASVAFGLVSLVFLLLLKRGLPRVWKHPAAKLLCNIGPLALMVVSISIMASTTPAEGPVQKNSWGLQLVGSVCATDNPGPFYPECMPSFAWPLDIAKHVYSISFEELISMLPAAITITLVGYIESMAIAKTVARQQAKNMGFHAQIVPSNELFALGASMVMASLFKGYPIDGSFSRTAINGAVGAQSPISGLVAAVIIGLAMLVLIPFLQYTPKAALGAVVIQGCISLVNFGEGVSLWRTARRDSYTFWITTIATMLLGVQPALMIGVGLCWILFLSQRSPARVSLLGSPAPAKAAEAEAEAGAEAKQIDDEVVVVDLYDSTAAQGRVHAVVLSAFGDFSFSSTPDLKLLVNKMSDEFSPAVLVLDCSSAVAVDGSGIQALKFMSEQLSADGTVLLLINIASPLQAALSQLVAHDKVLAGMWCVDDDDVEGKPGADDVAVAVVPAPPRLLVSTSVRKGLRQLQGRLHARDEAKLVDLSTLPAIFKKAAAKYIRARPSWLA